MPLGELGQRVRTMLRPGGTLAARATVVALVAVLCGGLVYRLAVVAEYQAPAGDGRQYHRLSQELLRDGRLAYDPKEEPTFTRLPGYPLFLAYVAVRREPLSLQEHLKPATRANAILDIGTALLVFLILRERRMGSVAGLLAAVAIIGCPSLLVLSAYGLTESLATFLTTLALFLGLRAMRQRPVLHGALAGAVIGLLQLTRPDGALVAPAVGLAILLGEASLRRRLVGLVALAAAAAAVFAPWPIRNQLRFGEPHFLATTWVAQNGEPLPTGLIEWMMTWARGEVGEEYNLLRLSRQLTLDADHPQVLLPTMYDSEEEHRRVGDLFMGYNVARLSPEVDSAFRALARERFQRAPLRTLVSLPAQRLLHMWKPLPPYDFPMKSKLLRLPRRRADVGDWDRQMLLCAVLGCLLLPLVRRGGPGWRTVAVIATAVAVNSVVHVFAHPCPVQRYVVEVMPVLIGLAAFGLSAALLFLLQILARPRPGPEPGEPKTAP